MSSSRLRIAIALLISSAFAQNECYYAADKRAGSAIIPCGGGGQQSACCQLGDLCLSDSACWNPDYNVTYLYGCTDSSYQDPTCPWKCGDNFAGSPYVGLDYCVNTTKNEWSCTYPPDNSDAIHAFPAQECLDDSIIAFAGPSVLQPILSLPEAQGASTLWFSEVNPTSWTPVTGYTPTQTYIQVTASVPTAVELVSTSSTTTSTRSTTSTPTSTSSQSPTSAQPGQTSSTGSSSPTAEASSGGLSSGAKIGIGVGVGIGALGLLALGAAFFLMRRRRDGHRPVSQFDDSTSYPEETKDKKPRPPSELPDQPMKYDPPTGYGTGHGTGTGTGHGTNSSTVSNWDSPVPTYASSPEPAAGPRPMGHDRVHELG